MNRTTLHLLVLGITGLFYGCEKGFKVPPPDNVSTFSLIAPAVSPARNATPTIRVSNVENGDIVTLYSNSSCTNNIATTTATGVTVDFTPTLAQGTHRFYSKINRAGDPVSKCSRASLTYVYYECPTGYIHVTKEATLGTDADFCVAKYEMKDVGGVATSQAANAPWVSISQIDAIAECAALNTGSNTNYALMNIAERMTIARDIEAQNANWSVSAGVGMLVSGHSDNNPVGAQAAGADNDPYFNTNNTAVQAAGAGWEQRRTHELSNGEIIWDFAGNVWDWIDWNVTPAEKAYIAVDGGPVLAWREFQDLNTKIGVNDEMKPITWQSAYHPALNTTLNRIGGYYANVNTTGGAAYLGGAWANFDKAGIYALTLSLNPASVAATITFRCVYRP